MWGELLWFWALFAMPALLALFLYAEQRRRMTLLAFAGVRLAPQLLASFSLTRRWLWDAMLLFAVALVVAALNARRKERQEFMRAARHRLARLGSGGHPPSRQRDSEVQRKAPRAG